MWNELRIGWTIDFEIASLPLYVNVQYLFGFGLVKGRKPDNFGKDGDGTFRAPLFFIRYRF